MTERCVAWADRVGIALRQGDKASKVKLLEADTLFDSTYHALDHLTKAVPGSRVG